MGRQEQIVKERLRKVEELRKEGIDPYPNGYDVTHYALDLQVKHAKLKAGKKSNETVSLAGRLMTYRDFGKIAFGVLNDSTGKIQITLQKDETPTKIMKFLKKSVDSGDFVGVEGLIMRTERGELSILVKKAKLLTKSIHPLPEKWHGIQNEEDRYRKRYLDILMNTEVKDMFQRKSNFWRAVRDFLLEKGFTEVETPVLENSAGGAAATPFKTHHNALGTDVFLRISMGELWQKKLMVAGLGKTFEIGRQFRNEGMDAEHLQDYTQMEFYWSYANYKDGMELTKEMYREVAKKVFNKTKFEHAGHKFDLADKWKIIDYVDEIKKQTKVNVLKADKKDILKALDKLGQEHDKSYPRVKLIDSLWKYCRKHISGPAFLTGQLAEVTPLAKRDPKRPDRVEQFQIILGGSEMGNGYSELNDAIDQDERFKDQRKLAEEGDDEAHDHDEGFVEALKHGMPPTCGFGFSERLFSFLEGKPIRECVIFPLMKPEASGTGKSKETKLAVAVVNNKIEPWEQMNTVAHLNAAFAARIGKQLFLQDSIKTKDGENINLNIQHAIMIKEADSNKSILELVKNARKEELEVSEFTREMIETTDDKKVIEKTKKKDLKNVEYLGALVFGSKKDVEKISKDFELFGKFSHSKNQKGGKK